MEKPLPGCIITIRQHPSKTLGRENYQNLLAFYGFSLRMVDRRTNTTWQRFLSFSLLEENINGKFCQAKISQNIRQKYKFIQETEKLQT